MLSSGGLRSICIALFSCRPTRTSHIIATATSTTAAHGMTWLVVVVVVVAGGEAVCVRSLG